MSDLTPGRPTCSGARPQWAPPRVSVSNPFNLLWRQDCSCRLVGDVRRRRDRATRRTAFISSEGQDASWTIGNAPFAYTVGFDDSGRLTAREPDALALGVAPGIRPGRPTLSSSSMAASWRSIAPKSAASRLTRATATESRLGHRAAPGVHQRARRRAGHARLCRLSRHARRSKRGPRSRRRRRRVVALSQIGEPAARRRWLEPDLGARPGGARGERRRLHHRAGSSSRNGDPVPLESTADRRRRRCRSSRCARRRACSSAATLVGIVAHRFDWAGAPAPRGDARSRRHVDGDLAAAIRSSCRTRSSASSRAMNQRRRARAQSLHRRRAARTGGRSRRS